MPRSVSGRATFSKQGLSERLCRTEFWRVHRETTTKKQKKQKEVRQEKSEVDIFKRTSEKGGLGW